MAKYNMMPRIKTTHLLSLFLCCIIILLAGCYTEREYTFQNISYDKVYNKSIDFISSRKWVLLDQDKRKGLISFRLRERIVTDPMVTVSSRASNQDKYDIGDNSRLSPQGYGGPKIIKDIIFINIRQVGKDVIVKLNTDTESFWNPNITFDEYKKFVLND